MCVRSMNRHKGTGVSWISIDIDMYYVICKRVVCFVCGTSITLDFLVPYGSVHTHTHGFEKEDSFDK